MKALLCLLMAGLVLGSGCVNPMIGFVEIMEENGVVSFFEDVERAVPPPSFLKPYFANQEVPLNNIPNADMENWSVAWAKTTTQGLTTADIMYSGDTYFADGTSLRLYARGSGSVNCGYPATNTCTDTTQYFTAESPSFVLGHDYITFYLRGDALLYLYTGIGGGNLRIGFLDSNGNVISQRTIATLVSQTIRVEDIPSTILKGTFAGEDGKNWYKITIPTPSSFKNTNVKIFFTTTATNFINNYCQCYHGDVKFYIDNFYYSNSDGSEIYALETPTAQFTYVVDGYDVSVDAGISQTVGTLYQIKWNWGDGTQTTGVTSSHTYAFSGNKRITLTIMSNEDLIDTATLTVSVDGTSYYTGPEGSNTVKIAPVAGFSYELTGMAIEVDGSYSTDDGTIALYSWDFDGVKKNGITATHTYLNSGSKTVTLTVTDNMGLEGTRKITFDLPVGGVTTGTIINDNPGTPPTAKFTYTFATPTITVDASGSSDDVKIEKYEWNWGDGSTGLGKTTSHTYSDMGAGRTIILTVTDNQGFTDSAEAYIVTQSYNEPANVSSPDYIAPPVISGGSTPVTAGGSGSNAFSVWGFIVFVGFCALIVGGLALLLGGKKKKPRRIGKRRGGKRR